MICKWCRKKVKKAWTSCPHCGEAISTGSESVKKKGKMKYILIAIVVLIVLVFGSGMLSEDDSKADEITAVQNGYLGNYNTVNIKEVLEYNWANGTWDSGITDEDELLVNYQTDDKNVVQFIMGEDMKTFKVSALQADNLEGNEASDIKWYLDGMYENYAKKFINKGIIINTSLDNDTLKGSTDLIVKSNKENSFEESQETFDFADYLDMKLSDYIDKIPISLEKIDLGYSDENEFLTILSFDYNTVDSIYIECSNIGLYGIYIGENKNDVAKIEGYSIVETSNLDSSKLTFVSDNETKAVVLEFDESDRVNSISYVLLGEESIKDVEETNEEDEELTKESEDNTEDISSNADTTEYPPYGKYALYNEDGELHEKAEMSKAGENGYSFENPEIEPIYFELYDYEQCAMQFSDGGYIYGTWEYQDGILILIFEESYYEFRYEG